jgi:hypothetical protein
VKNYMDGYLDSYKETVGADWMGKRGIRYVINDSWEAGSQNWTDDMIASSKSGAATIRIPGCRCSPGGGRERRGQRPVPVGLSQDHRRPDRRRALRPGGGVAQERGMGHYGESHEGAARSSPTAWR